MKFEFSLVNPDELMATMEITMSVKEWKQLQKAVDSDVWPGRSFSLGISEIINAAQKHFYKSLPASPTNGGEGGN